MTLKTESQIWREIISVVNAALTERGIVGFTVKQGNQPVKVTPERPVITITKVAAVQNGSQFRRDNLRTDFSGIDHEEGYLLEATYQLTAFKLRGPVTETDYTINAADAVEAVKSYLMSTKGLKHLKALGYGILPVKNLRQPVWVDEADNYELNPNFDFTLVFKQSYEHEQPVIAGHAFTLIRI